MAGRRRRSKRTTAGRRREDSEQDNVEPKSLVSAFSLGQSPKGKRMKRIIRKDFRSQSSENKIEYRMHATAMITAGVDVHDAVDSILTDKSAYQATTSTCKSSSKRKDTASDSDVTEKSSLHENLEKLFANDSQSTTPLKAENFLFTNYHRYNLIPSDNKEVSGSCVKDLTCFVVKFQYQRKRFKSMKVGSTICEVDLDHAPEPDITSCASTAQPAVARGCTPENGLSLSEKSDVASVMNVDTKAARAVPDVANSTLEDVFPNFSIENNVLLEIASLNTVQDTNKKPQSQTPEIERTMLQCPQRKLIILDLNGLLADVNPDFQLAHRADMQVSGKAVFKRPFCDEFLRFCFERFNVGVWSSRRSYNLDGVVDYLMGSWRHKLLFCWDQSKCTDTWRKTIENRYKPLLLKELKKLWDKEDDDLPWKKGEYQPSNTLLVDDSPYKAISNPPHTAIFPVPYHFRMENDDCLGPQGDLRCYLEGLAMADDVQHYVKDHPFGQEAISDTNPSWQFYRGIIDEIKERDKFNNGMR